MIYTTKRHYELPKLRDLREAKSSNPPVVYGDSAKKFIRQRSEAMASEPAKAPLTLTWEQVFDQKVVREMRYDLLEILKDVDAEIRKSPHNPPELAVLKVLGPKASVDDFSSH